MKLIINGNEVVLEHAVTIEELLVLQKVKMPEYVTVQLNEQFVDRSEFSKITVNDNDAVDFLYFMGGGN